jgi:membrane-associated phospholipid phosphatase
MIRQLIFICAFLVHSFLLAQNNKPVHKRIYKTNPIWEIPVSAAFFVAAPFAFKKLDEVARYSASDVVGLNPANINSFDRPVAFYDPARFASSEKKSDLFLNLSVAAPAILLLDKRIRKDWKDFFSLFLMTHMVDNSIYFAATFSSRRARPLTYNPKVPLEEKTGVGKSNSFFSGHTSWSAASMFLIVKMYTDYHGIKGWKRIALYTGAAIPPGLVGYYRMHAGKHFKTDIITGLVIGAASGIGVPGLHKRALKNPSLSFQPFYFMGARGISVRYIKQ